MGGTKLERFLLKNQHPQRKLLNFENWISGGLRIFQTGDTKLEGCLSKNQHPQRKLLNFENWMSGGLRSFQKSDFY